MPCLGVHGVCRQDRPSGTTTAYKTAFPTPGLRNAAGHGAREGTLGARHLGRRKVTVYAAHGGPGAAPSDAAWLEPQVAQMRLRGWVYVITNAAMPNLLKIGYSMKDPWIRASELATTGAPHPYKVEYDVLVFEPREIEQAAHMHLSGAREGREWFRCAVDEAVQAILEVCEERENVLVETRHQGDQSVASTERSDLISRRRRFEGIYGPGFRPASDYTTVNSDPAIGISVRGGSPSAPITRLQKAPSSNIGGQEINYKCIHCGASTVVPYSFTVRCSHCGKTGYA